MEREGHGCSHARKPAKPQNLVKPPDMSFYPQTPETITKINPKTMSCLPSGPAILETGHKSVREISDQQKAQAPRLRLLFCTIHAKTQLFAATPLSAGAKDWASALEHDEVPGELSEYAFVYKAASLGFGVARPYSEGEQFDFILISRGWPEGDKLWRIQVKSTSSKLGRAVPRDGTEAPPGPVGNLSSDGNRFYRGPRCAGGQLVRAANRVHHRADEIAVHAEGKAAERKAGRVSRSLAPAAPTKNRVAQTLLSACRPSTTTYLSSGWRPTPIQELSFRAKRGICCLPSVPESPPTAGDVKGEGHAFGCAPKPQARSRPRRACPERSRRGPTPAPEPLTPRTPRSMFLLPPDVGPRSFPQGSSFASQNLCVAESGDQ